MGKKKKEKLPTLKEIDKLVLKTGKRYSIISDLDNLEEEAAELIQAIAKYKRAISNDKKYNPTSLSKNKAMKNIIEEIGDVEIVILKIKKKLNISNKDIKKEKLKKIERQKKRNKKSKKGK